MAKSLYIAEKPSVAQQFAAALKKNWRRVDGYQEADDAIVTWCVGHLVTMSYPEAYDPAYKRWSLQTLPFLPKEFKYQVIDSVAKQFNIVSGLLNRPDVDVIYICTDSGREGEYIYRLVDQMAGVKGKTRRRVWIDSQTEEEILRGIREAKDWTEYDNLSASAYLRAKEDYLMGINFSRLLTLKYGNAVSNFLKQDRTVVSVGRVMTCVLGMVVRREREIREFVKTPFYRVIGTFGKMADGPGRREEKADGVMPLEFDAEWRCVEGSKYYGTPFLYKENGFKERKTAEELIAYLTRGGTADAANDSSSGSSAAPGIVAEGREAAASTGSDAASENTATPASAGGPKMKPESRPDCPERITVTVASVERKKETKNPPLLYNLAELQNDCSKMFKISPDQTLQIVQELYEKKLVTYPRTDARVLSTAVAKEIHKNIGGLRQFAPLQAFAEEILQSGSYKNIAKTRYVNDKQITDHYAIVPTGQGFGALRSLKPLALKVYEVIARRFLSIFYPAAVYQKTSLELVRLGEHFFASFKVLVEQGYLKVADVSGGRKKAGREDMTEPGGDAESSGSGSRAESIGRGTSRMTADAGDGKDAAGSSGGAGSGSEDIRNSGTAADSDDSERNRRDLENPEFLKMLASLKKGMELGVFGFTIREGETSPPKRYTSGSMILAMENAGQLIEDEELRAQIKGSGIGTSATRAEILKKLVNIKYLALNNKTQVITPTLLGELVYEVVAASIRQLLNPDLTASWEKGLTYVAEGSITPDEYMQKLEHFVAGRTGSVMRLNNQYQLRDSFDAAARYYKR